MMTEHGSLYGFQSDNVDNLAMNLVLKYWHGHGIETATIQGSI